LSNTCHEKTRHIWQASDPQMHIDNCRKVDRKEVEVICMTLG